MFEDLEAWQQARHLDNYPRSAPVAERLRGTAISVGKLVSGLLHSTEGKADSHVHCRFCSLQSQSPSLYLPIDPMKISIFQLSAFPISTFLQ